MDRATLQSIAIAKLKDAELLFEHRRHSNSFYLFGYAVEIAIKARISLLFQPQTIPDRKLVNAVYTHNLNELIGVAGLADDLRAERNRSAVFNGHWSAVSDWSESARYEVIDVFVSTAMRNAVMDENAGVFKWLQERW